MQNYDAWTKYDMAVQTAEALKTVGSVLNLVEVAQMGLFLGKILELAI